MGRIFDEMSRFFEEDDWKASPIEDKPILRMVYAGDNAKFMCYAQAREEQEQFVFYCTCPVNAPEDSRAAVAEFITRANYGMIIGNFEMDHTDGEIRYKTSLAVRDELLTQGLIKNAVWATVFAMDRYLPGIMSVIFAGASPAEAVAKVES